MRIECSLHFQFIVDEEIYILLHALSVYNVFVVILIIRVFKFRPSHGFTVHGHYRRVVLSQSRTATPQCGGQQYSSYSLHSFHIPIQDGYS